jgi:addiction module HigA family antidote
MKPVTPGEILLEEYLKPLGLSQNAVGRAVGVSPRAINEIVLGRRSITPEMSIRLGKYFGQSPQFWFGIQTNCDFRRLRKREQELTAKIQPFQHLVDA